MAGLLPECFKAEGHAGKAGKEICSGAKVVGWVWDGYQAQSVSDVTLHHPLNCRPRKPPHTPCERRLEFLPPNACAPCRFSIAFMPT